MILECISGIDEPSLLAAGDNHRDEREQLPCNVDDMIQHPSSIRTNQLIQNTRTMNHNWTFSEDTTEDVDNLQTQHFVLSTIVGTF
jgi:hypothetical protein